MVGEMRHTVKEMFDLSYGLWVYWLTRYEKQDKIVGNKKLKFSWARIDDKRSAGKTNIRSVWGGKYYLSTKLFVFVLSCNSLQPIALLTMKSLVRVRTLFKNRGKTINTGRLWIYLSSLALPSPLDACITGQLNSNPYTHGHIPLVGLPWLLSCCYVCKLPCCWMIIVLISFALDNITSSHTWRTIKIVKPLFLFALSRWITL